MSSSNIKTIFENKAVRAAVFIIIAALLFVYLNRVFYIGNSNLGKQIFNEFYNEQENTIDVLYLGTSATNRYFIPPVAYNEEGIASFNLATMGLPMIFVPNLIDEVEKTQSPQLYIIELRNVLSSKELITEGHISRVIDSMLESENKNEALDKAIDYTEGAVGEFSRTDKSSLEDRVPIVKYHVKYSAGEIRYKDFLPGQVKNKAKGYVLSKSGRLQVPYEPPVYTNKYKALAPEMEDALNAALDRCDTLDAEVLFVFSPYAMRKNDQAKFNTAIKIVEERGYTVLDCNQKEVTDEMAIDWEHDLYDNKHVNFVGAEKYTKYLLSYLMDNYNLPDRRGDTKWDSWAEAYEEYLDFTSRGLRYPIIYKLNINNRSVED